MPYKVGFQPAGVKHDRTAEFHSDRKRMAEEREKEEGRLGRRWAKVRPPKQLSHESELTSSWWIYISIPQHNLFPQA
jgi:hypothetical protein